MPTEIFVAEKLCLKEMRLFSEIMILNVNRWISSKMDNLPEYSNVIAVKIASYPHYSKMNTFSLLKTAQDLVVLWDRSFFEN